MENCRGGRVGIFWFFLGIFVLFRCVRAQNERNPTKNVNLTPFMAWRSAYYCLKNVSDSCPGKYVLKEGGWLNVTHEDGEEFCRVGGCADHTRAVLSCLHYVKRDYWFANKATVKHLNDTIHLGCNTPPGFNGTSLYPTSGYKKKSASGVLTLLALVFISLFYM